MGARRLRISGRIAEPRGTATTLADTFSWLKGRHAGCGTDAPPPALREARTAVRSLGGRVAGIAQWLRIELAPGVAYENAPGSDERHQWLLSLHATEPRETAAGEHVAIGGWHDAQTLALWLEPGER